MSFPYHDPAWVAAGQFVRAHAAAEETILAPDAFSWWFERIHRYANTRLRPQARYDWAIVHNWMLHHLEPRFLAALDSEMRPVHAHGVFVVWRRRSDLPRLSRFDRGVAAFRRNRRDLRLGNGRYAAGPEFAGPDPGHPDPGEILRFRSVPPASLKHLYNRIFENGGYRYETARDRAYTRDLDARTRDLLGDVSGLDVLDVACGEGRVGHLVEGCASFLGIDLAETAIRRCRHTFAGSPDRRFAVMDAERMALPAARFDAVTLIDSSEHIAHFDAALAEIIRVLRPGGLFVMSGQNRNSLHLLANRKLGYPDCLTNNQHIREFTVAEIAAMLGERGFTVARTAGVLLYPYWEIPGVDEHMRGITDDDAEFAEAMSVLGQRAGADYAYTFLIAARKGR